jgi:probable F420-dependent oxidoreductase
MPADQAGLARFGVFLPSWVWPGDGPDRVRGLLDFARAAEAIGFDSVWITDHVIAAQHFYRVSWLEPLTTLSFVAAATSRVRLGTSILILPVRQPVILAKEIANLEYLSGGRYIIGGGVGWYPPEFEACGTRRQDRGPRSDEALDIVRGLLTTESFSFQGRFFSIRDVSIEPRPTVAPPVWIAGGSQLADERSPELPVFAPSVMERIRRADGWIARPTAHPDQIAADRAALAAQFALHGDDVSRIVAAHENFLHLVPTTDHDRAVREQHEAFSRVMSEARGERYLESVYLFGTPDEIVRKLQARADAGIGYFMLHTLTPDPAQLEVWAREILPHVRMPDATTEAPR